MEGDHVGAVQAWAAQPPDLYGLAQYLRGDLLIMCIAAVQHLSKSAAQLADLYAEHAIHSHIARVLGHKAKIVLTLEATLSHHVPFKLVQAHSYLLADISMPALHKLQMQRVSSWSQ